MKKTTAPIPFAGSELGETRHVCAFFNSDEEEYRVYTKDEPADYWAKRGYSRYDGI